MAGVFGKEQGIFMPYAALRAASLEMMQRQQQTERSIAAVSRAASLKMIQRQLLAVILNNESLTLTRCVRRKSPCIA